MKIACYVFTDYPYLFVIDPSFIFLLNKYMYVVSSLNKSII